MRADCACWRAPDSFAARQRRGGMKGAATPPLASGGGPPPAWSLLMKLWRPHRAVAPASRAPTDTRGHHARPHARILPTFKPTAKLPKNVDSQSNFYPVVNSSLSTFSRCEIHNDSITFLHVAFSPVFRILHKNGFEPIRQKPRFFPSKKPESA
jgi:hypothetical protein